MIFIVYLVSALITCLGSNCKMITKQQWNYYQHLILKPSLSNSMREKVDYILFMRHQPLIHRMGRNFVAYHKHKSKFIIYEDIVQHGASGLLHAIRNYNGRSSFYRYAQTYINGAMYKGLTVHYPITAMSAKERKKRKQVNYTNFDDCGPLDRHRNIYLGKNTFVKSPYESQYLSKFFDDCIAKWKIINNMPAFTMRVMYQKYDFEFNILRSNKEISLLNSCSEETIRKNVKMAISNLTTL